MDSWWEPTANKLLQDENGKWINTGGTEGRDLTAEYGEGLVRIGVRASDVPTGWAKHVRRSGIDKKFARSLAKAAEQDGSQPYNWRVSYEPIPRDRWVVVQTWNGKRWVEMPESGPIPWEEYEQNSPAASD
jgi:hypothetical protein